jgi:hypothetical protein
MSTHVIPPTLPPTLLYTPKSSQWRETDKITLQSSCNLQSEIKILYIFTPTASRHTHSLLFLVLVRVTRRGVCNCTAVFHKQW